MLENFVINFLIVGSLFGPTVMVAWRQPKRNLFWLRLLIGFAVMYAFAVTMNEAANVYTDNYFWLNNILKFFVLYVFLFLGVWFCFNCSVWSAIFCATAGYCLEHMSQRLYAIFEANFFYYSLNAYARKMISVIITSCFCVGFYFLVLRRSKYSFDSIIVDNRLQILIASCIITVVIFVNTLAMQGGIGVERLSFIYISSIMSALLALLVEVNMMFSKKTENELLALKRLLHEERLQYLKEKENIQLINIKCHDMRHQINSLKGKIADSEINDISHAMDIYDSSIKTGNEALDVILTQKSLYCKHKQIKLTCLIDGAKLNFIPEHELYSLFGNAIDNSIEGVEKLAPESRIISVTEKMFGEFLNIRIENYFIGEIKFVNGLPATQKNSDYHGFGMKSIKMLLEKYDGRLHAHVAGNIFTLDLFLPYKRRPAQVSS